MRSYVLAPLAVLSLLVGCGDSSASARIRVKSDSIAKVLVARDSVAAVGPMVFKVVAGLVTRNEPTQALGGYFPLTAYYLVAPDLTVCRVEAAAYATTRVGVTLGCHWHVMTSDAQLRRELY